MANTTVRTAKKQLLGHEIAYMIAQAGISQSEAAKILQKGQTYIATLINGGGAISLGDLLLLAKGLGFTDEGHLDALCELRKDNHKRGYWAVGHNRAYSQDIRLQIDLERHADQLRSLELEAIPGLMQCESYVRALHTDQPEVNGITLDDMITARLARQAILETEDPPLMHYVLSESCLRRVRGGRSVMSEQMAHLLALVKRPNVHLQVLPFDLPDGQRVAMSSPFVLIRVPSPGPAGPLEMVYVEGEAEIRYLDERKALRAYEAAWTRLSDAALTFAESRKFIEAVARDHAAAASR